MKFLGKVQDPKDITTKEYVDTADAKLKKETNEALSNKVNAKDILEYTTIEVLSLWNTFFKKSK